jgi:hypothetical protein
LNLGLLISCGKDDKQRAFVTETEVITVGPGPEDILIDSTTGIVRLLISCSERRDKKPAFGEIQSMDFETKVITTLPRENHPDSIPFHPHGFYLQTIGGTPFLFVVNHYSDESKRNVVLKYKVLADKLVFEREYRSDLMISPNEVCALPDGSFFFTNDMGSDDLIYEQLVNPFGGSLVYVDAEGNARYAERELSFPNGLEYKDGKLWMATTRNKAMFRYNVSADGQLTEKTKISTINGMDNIRFCNGKLIVAVHPDEIAFVAHSVSTWKFSPGVIYAIDPDNGASKVLYENNGKYISGGSTAVEYKGQVYISQVFEPFLLWVKN